MRHEVTCKHRTSHCLLQMKEACLCRIPAMLLSKRGQILDSLEDQRPPELEGQRGHGEHFFVMS